MAVRRAVKNPPSAPCPGGRGRPADWPKLAGILLIGLLLRAAYLRELVHTPDFATPLADAAFHDYWAQALVTGDWTLPAGTADPGICTTPFLRPPGYPYFLACIYRVAGPGNYLGVRVVQMGLGLVSAVLAYLLGRSLFGRGAGLIAALFLSVFWSFIYYEGELQEPFLLVLLGLAGLLVLRGWAVRPAWWRAGVAGVLLGVYALVRSNILLFCPVVVLWAAWILWRRKELRRWPVSALALAVGAGLMIAPATIRNYVVARDFVLISSNGAINLYIGNNERSDGYTARIPDLVELTGENVWSWFLYGKIVKGVEAQVGRPLSQSEVSAYFRDKALHYMRANPGRCAQLALQRALLFWGPAEVANNKEVHFERQHSGVLRLLPGWPLALATGVLGLLLLTRPSPDPSLGGRGALRAGQWATVVLILLFIGVWFASFVPFLVAERFRVPVMPFLLLLGAHGVSRLGTQIAARNWRSAGGWAVAGLALFGLAEVPLVDYEPQLAGWCMARGDAFLRRGEPSRAIDEYTRAVAAKPAYVVARQRLASLLSEQGRKDEALREYRALLELTPDDADLHNDLGQVLTALGRHVEAEAAYRSAVRVQPEFAAAHVNLGNALTQQRRLDEAVAEYRRALAIKPGFADAHFNLGIARVAQGAIDEAMAAYRAALAARPDFAGARVNLGILLAGKGQLDAAITEYQQVLAADPNFFEAHCNLASALVAKGQLDEAAAELRKALAIRPDAVPVQQALQTLEQQLQQGSAP